MIRISPFAHSRVPAIDLPEQPVSDQCLVITGFYRLDGCRFSLSPHQNRNDLRAERGMRGGDVDAGARTAAGPDPHRDDAAALRQGERVVADQVRRPFQAAWTSPVPRRRSAS